MHPGQVAGRRIRLEYGEAVVAAVGGVDEGCGRVAGDLGGGAGRGAARWEGGGSRRLLCSLVCFLSSCVTQLARHSVSAIARCVGGRGAKAGKSESKSTVERFIKELSSAQASSSEQVKQLLLHCIGEIGRESDLSSFSLETVVLASFSSMSEDTKAAASLALGSLAVGAIQKYLPFILTQVTARAEYRCVGVVSLLCFC